jgi:hypothetical protein
VYIGTLDAPDTKLLFDKASAANLAFTQGWALFMRETTLMAQRFDMRKLSVVGEPTPIAEDVEKLGNPSTGLFSASQNGVLVFETGTLGTSVPTWYDRAGKVLATVGQPALYRDLEISPDGARAAVTIATASNGTRDVWVLDLARGVRTRLTSDPGNEDAPVWSADGQTIAFEGDKTGYTMLYRKASSGVGNEEPLGISGQMLSWSADDANILYAAGAPYNLWVLPRAGDRKPFRFVKSPFLNLRGKFSPDGRWVSYDSTESGSVDIYVTQFPQGNTEYRVSTAGGSWSRWRRDGKELFYVDPTNRLMAAEVDGQGSSFKIGAVHPLFPINVPSGFRYVYDVSPDG